MRSLLRAVSQTGIHIYVLGSVLTTGVPFLLLPILLRKLTPSEYGIVAIYQVLQMFCLVGLNFETGLARELAVIKPSETRKYVSTSIGSALGSSALVGLLGYVFLNQLSAVSQFPKEWLWAVLASSVCQQMVVIACTVAQMSTKPAQYAAFRVSSALSEIGVSLVLVCVFNWGWRGRVLGNVLGWSAGAVISLVWLKLNNLAGVKLDIACLKRLAGVGLPSVPHTLAGFVWGWGDRLMLSRMLTLRDVGIYAVASQSAMAINVLSTSVHLGWVPWLYRRLASGPDRQAGIAPKVLLLQGGWLVGASLYGVALTGFFRYGPAGGYRDAAQLTLLLAVGWGINAMYKTASAFIFYSGRTGWLSLSTIASASCSLLLMRFLVPSFRMNGAALGFVAGSVVMFALSSLFAHRFYPLAYRLRLPERGRLALNAAIREWRQILN